jgi:hypothetical protein
MAKDIILKIIGDIGTDGANYKAMQFAGSIMNHLPMEERLTLTNMTTEAGAKNGIIEPDETTYSYLRERTETKYSPVHGDPDAHYSEVFTYPEGQKGQDKNRGAACGAVNLHEGIKRGTNQRLYASRCSCGPAYLRRLLWSPHGGAWQG